MLPLLTHSFPTRRSADLGDCGTRPPLRQAMVMAALGAGKHVYNGIPFAKDLADARAMAAAWRSAGTVAVVDAFMQAVPAIVQMKAMIDAGWIGEVFGADVAFEVPLFRDRKSTRLNSGH